ncbi:hypothetical protein HMPREF1317_2200 [Schaalia georgiae F0490]|uniref:Uncharacterized protein n=1 Tax=Schaalia georgiae F0490 TaxID=1125717 RepID=J0NGE1_9ACTO|nr:hypothetical protein HMPREF1317_2200 [Schaalia georgiae F0490]
MPWRGLVAIKDRRTTSQDETRVRAGRTIRAPAMVSYTCSTNVCSMA